MAATGIATFLCELIGTRTGVKLVKLVWTITNGSPVVTVPTISGAGNTTVDVPSGTKLIIIQPPAANSQALTLKGNSGDTGVRISNTEASILAWQTGASFILTSAGAVVGLEINFL